MEKKYKDIVIFGESRAGKTILANRISRELPYKSIHVDMHRDTLAKVWPDLGVKTNTAIENESFQKYINLLFWGEKHQTRGEYGVIIEGFEISRKAIEQYYLNSDTLVYALGLQNISAEKFMANLRKNDKKDYDWTYDLNDKELLKFAKERLQASKDLFAYCQQMGIPFYNTANNREEVFGFIIEDVRKRGLKR